MYPVALKAYNTMQIDVSAKALKKIDTLNDLRHIDWPNLGQFIVLGGGSNTLFTDHYPGTVLLMRMKGKKILQTTATHILLHVGAGEDWTKLVDWVVAKGWGGLENLSFIPGTAGAAPVQNIAAYGQNFSDTLDLVECFDVTVGKPITLSKEACKFGYRTSLFKLKPGRFIITGIVVKLNRKPELNTSYFSIGRRNDSIEKSLKEAHLTPPYHVKDIAAAVTRIRRQKLPDVAKIPSVGSFFLNPLVNRNQLNLIMKDVDNLQYYPPDQLRYLPLDDAALKDLKQVKIPVGRLLDARGWTGRQLGHCYIYPKWASIITHDGLATGREVYDFTRIIAQDIKRAYDITLESEVTIV